MTKPTVIDLFSGSGGLSLGFEAAGYEILAGNDLMTCAGTTFRAMHPDAHFYDQSISNLSADQLLEDTGLIKGELDCLIGGPPCQGYSVYNHQRGMHDERSHLFREFLRLTEGLQPKWVVIENVTGILSMNDGDVVAAIEASLRKLGYKEVAYKVLRAEDYGVPQERRRLVIIANRLGLPVRFPRRTHGPDRIPFVTIKDAIGDLPRLSNGENKGSVPYPSAPRSDFQRSLRFGSSKVHNHAAPKLGQINLDRMKHIPQGGSWRDIPFDLLPNGMKKAKRSDHTKRYGRLKNDGLASTILTKCDIHWGAYIHPEQDRSLTVREAARLQSFPDTFVFTGSRTEQYVQVGNAVPPLLAQAIAECILDMDSVHNTKPVLKVA